MEVVCEFKMRQKWLKLMKVCILLNFGEFSAISRKGLPLLTLRTRQYFFVRLKSGFNFQKCFAV